MGPVTDRTIHAGRATPESAWLACPAVQEAPVVEAVLLVPEGGRAVIVAPHPDDEVLLAGGLMRQLTQLGRDVCLVAVTDGEASHPGSTRWPGAWLARTRVQEQLQALRELGAAGARVHRLNFPDGGLQARHGRLTQALRALLAASDVVLTPWSLDGHPDHEAVGTACAQATGACGARHVEVPVWGWHWSRPEDTPMPWHRARRLLLSPSDVRAKGQALRMYRSQLEPDPSTGASPILDAASLARASRPFELLFV